MITPKEKAKELVSKYMMVDTHDEDHFIIRQQRGKKCALIAVDEILSELTEIPYGLEYLNRLNYWLEVKQEIEKL